MHWQMTQQGKMCSIEKESLHELEETLNGDTSCVASLDTGSTFDSSNNEKLLAEIVEAIRPIASRTNVGR